MPINKYRHMEEPGTYFVKTIAKAGLEPTFKAGQVLPWNGKRLGVHFSDGVGITRDRQKAIIFDEQFGFEITLPEGEEAWELAMDPEKVIATKKEDWKDEAVRIRLADETAPAARLARSINKKESD